MDIEKKERAEVLSEVKPENSGATQAKKAEGQPVKKRKTTAAKQGVNSQKSTAEGKKANNSQNVKKDSAERKKTASTEQSKSQPTADEEAAALKDADSVSEIGAEELSSFDAAEEELEEDSKQPKTVKKVLFKYVIPIAAAAIILTAGVVVSSVSLGLLDSTTHSAFVATAQSSTELAAPQGMFLEGISVQGVDLGGMTMKSARDLLMIKESEMIPSMNYTLNCGEKIMYLTEDDFTFSFDTVRILNEAYEYSEYMREILNDSKRASLKSSEKKDYTITMTFDDSSVGEVCKTVAQKVNVPVQDAHVTNIDVEEEDVAKMFSFASGVTGANLDVDDLTNQIATLIKNQEYTAEVNGDMVITEPKVTLEDLKKNLVLISQYVTYSGNTWEGNMNMTTAMKSMNGSIIRPGETFSFNGKTGNSNLPENGYYSAGVIVNGQSADGIGGGICQAATTIYNAAIRADMTVVEREPHTWPSVYVPIGIDSAIDYGNIDLKFRNDTEHEVYLICYMDGATLYAYIYGYKPTEFDEICTSSWYTGASGNGFGAVALRNYYKGGKIVKTEDLPSSFYSNGGGTSYNLEEAPSGYVFKRVFTDAQAADGDTGKPVAESAETTDTDSESTDTEAAETGDETAVNTAAEAVDNTAYAENPTVEDAAVYVEEPVQTETTFGDEGVVDEGFSEGNAEPDDEGLAEESPAEDFEEE